jgi:hypothetical protein
MSLFKFRTEKSSGDAVEAQSKQRVVAYSTLTDKVEALWNELSVIDKKLRDLVDQENELHAQLDNLETLVIDLGPKQSFPVSAYN